MVQVEFMTSQMSDMQHEVDDKLKTEQALKAAEQARKQVCLLSNGITISALMYHYKVTSCCLGMAAFRPVCERKGAYSCLVCSFAHLYGASSVPRSRDNADRAATV